MKLSIICATLFAAAVQARDFVLMDAASSRVRAYLVSQEEGQAGPRFVKEFNTPHAGGEQGVHVRIGANHRANVKYFSELLSPLTGPGEPYDVYIYGSGAIRDEEEDKQALTWTRIKSAIHDVAPDKFDVRAAETLPKGDESALTFKMLAGKPKTGLVDIGGVYLQVGRDSDNESFKNLGSVAASEAFAKNLLDSQNWSVDYANAVAELMNEKKTSKDLLVEVQEGGRLARFAQKIEHPCLMKARTPMEMIEAKSFSKSAEHMVSEVIPFKGIDHYEGIDHYDACFKAIATQIDEAVVGKKNVPYIPKDFALVGRGTLFHNQNNLKKLGIYTKTVGDVVAAAKTVCAYDFSEKYVDVGNKSLMISQHGLVELCWVSTYAATVLKHLLKLGDDQPLELTDKGWVLGMAQLIASEGANQEDFDYRKYMQ